MSKIHPQYIKGKFRTIKDYASVILLLVYFTGSWIRWGRGAGLPDQAIMIDLPGRRAYFFGIEIWPQETYYITGVLILAALGLFFFTSLFGRIWCGYACPQTVFVDIFRKIEHFFQGDRNERMKLDRSPLNRDKLLKKSLTYLSWCIVGFAFAFGFVCYFNDAPTLAKELISFRVGSNTMIWLLCLTASTCAFAGFVRERVCTVLCPYGRFQSAMVDKDTRVVTYHDWRGEPRGKPGADSGDCIDCYKCVVVCPMGIDIRDGLQMACIGCGLCIDACDSVMEKLDRTKGLIAYDGINSMQAKRSNQKISYKLFQLKAALFSAIFLLVSSIMVYSLLTKSDLVISINKDRGPLFTIIPDGSIRNTFILKVTNKTARSKNLILTIGNLEDATFMIQDVTEYIDQYHMVLEPEDEIEHKVFVKVPGDSNLKGQKKIYFAFNKLENNVIINEQTVFVFGK